MKKFKFPLIIKSFWQKLIKFIKRILSSVKEIKIKKVKLFSGKKALKILILIVLIYLVLGSVIAVLTYKYHKTSKVVKFSAKIYPLVTAWEGFHPVWMKDYYQFNDYITKYSQKTNQTLPTADELKKEITNQLIDQNITMNQAKKDGIKVTSKDVDAAYATIAQQYQGTDDITKVLNEMYGMTSKQFKKLVKNQVYIDKVQQDLLVQVHAEHILIKDETQAKKVLDIVKKGEKSFEDIAKEFSEDTGSKDNGGDLGWFGRGAMIKVFEDATLSTEPGKVKDDLVKSDFGYHIIKVLEKKGKVDKSYEDWLNEAKGKVKIRIWY